MVNHNQFSVESTPRSRAKKPAPLGVDQWGESPLEEKFRQRSKARRTPVSIENKSHLEATASGPGKRIENRPYLGVIVQQIGLKKDGLLGLINVAN
jgi:hypothetical protein